MSHIPKKNTTELEIPLFQESLRQYNQRQNIAYDHDKWLYVPDFYTEYRYILGTKGKNPLITIGINPSTASPGKLDNTIKAVERIARNNGFDSFIMFNVYAQRSTDPQKMETEFNTKLHMENMAAFEYVLSRVEKPSVWAAWGTNIQTRPYLKQCLTAMVKIGNIYHVQWWTCGSKSRVGNHPHHPLYLSKDAPLEVFDPVEYLASWGPGKYARKGL